MEKTLQNKLFGLLVALLIFAGASQTAMAVPPLPMIVDGVATVNGEVAPEGSTVSAIVDGECVGECEVSQDGKYSLLIQRESEDSGKTVTLEVSGLDAQKTETWESGKVVTHDLSVTGTPKPSKRSSSSKSETKASSVEENDVENENSPTQEDSVAKGAQEENPAPETDDNEEVATTETESDGEPSNSGGIPGFNLIYAVVGIVLVSAITRKDR